NLTSLAAMVLLPSRYHCCFTDYIGRISLLLIASCSLCGNGRSSGLATGAGLDQYAHDVVFLHDEVLDAVDLDFGARPFAEQHAVAGLEIDRNQLATFVAPAGPDRDNLALLRLLPGGIGDDDAAGGF